MIICAVPGTALGLAGSESERGPDVKFWLTAGHQSHDVIWVNANDFGSEGYSAFCSGVLSPTLHDRVPASQLGFQEYRRVNSAVASKLAATWRQLSLEKPLEVHPIWVHDYPLMLVPHFVKEMCPAAKVGYFLHAAFPTPEIFRCLVQRTALLEGILAADCVALQTDEFVLHFALACRQFLKAEGSLFLSHGKHMTVLMAAPAGVHVPYLEEAVSLPAVADARRRIRQRWPLQRLIVLRGVRGATQLLLAYEKLLQRLPHLVASTVLVQAGAPALLVARVNGMAGRLGLRPVELLEGLLFFEHLALLSEAAVFVVPLLREGLNVGCHEFVAVNHGPLVLSEFAGLLQLLSGALVVNPWDVVLLLQALEKALAMSVGDSDTAWRKNRAALGENSSEAWVAACVGVLLQADLRCGSPKRGPR